MDYNMRTNNYRIVVILEEELKGETFCWGKGAGNERYFMAHMPLHWVQKSGMGLTGLGAGRRLGVTSTWQLEDSD